MENLKSINEKIEKTHKNLIKAIHQSDYDKLVNVSDELEQIKILLDNLLAD